MPVRTFDTAEEQCAALEDIAQNIEGFWCELAKKAHGDLNLSAPASYDASALRLIASKLKEKVR